MATISAVAYFMYKGYASVSILCLHLHDHRLILQKFSERFGCLSDKCGKPKSVQWSLETMASVPDAQPGQVR